MDNISIPRTAILSWNVNGLLSKLDDDDFIDYLDVFDICILTETFMLQSSLNNLPLNNVVTHLKPAIKLSRQGRNSGGIICLIKKTLSNY